MQDDVRGDSALRAVARNSGAARPRRRSERPGRCPGTVTCPWRRCDGRAGAARRTHAGARGGQGNGDRFRVVDARRRAEPRARLGLCRLGRGVVELGQADLDELTAEAEHHRPRLRRPEPDRLGKETQQQHHGDKKRRHPMQGVPPSPQPYAQSFHQIEPAPSRLGCTGGRSPRPQSRVAPPAGRGQCRGRARRRWG